MKRISLWSLPISGLVAILLSACGGGGSSTAVLPAPSSPAAIVTLATDVTGTIPAGTTINSYEVTMTLPPDTTCRSTNKQTDPGVVTVIGSAATAGSFVTGVYTAATVSIPGTVKISIASGAGFDAGAFCTVRCELANGAQPKAADFAPLTLDEATGLVSGTTTTTLTGQLNLTATVVIQ